MIFPYRVREDVLLRALVAVGVLVATVVALTMSAAHAAPRQIDCGRFGCHDTHPTAAKHYAKRHHHRQARDANGNRTVSMCHPDTAAGRITIACDLVDKMEGFIRDVVARGFRGRVHCYARGGHVAHSLHYTGHACDFAQRGWGKTVRPMYHVAALAAKWGLRDGCTFRDCGHIDSGRAVRRTRVAGR